MQVNFSLPKSEPLQNHRNKVADDHRILCHGTVHSQDLNTCGGSIPKGLSEVWVSGIVRMEVYYIRHLNDEEYITAKSFLHAFLQSTEMFGPPLCGSIREGADAIIFQCYTLDFQKTLFAVQGKGKIKPGITVCCL